jgi:hypothetical protein
MSQSAGKGMLSDAVKSLHAGWRRCRDAWSDQASQQFERDFIDPVEPAARRAYDAMDRLQSACDDARRACE